MEILNVCYNITMKSRRSASLLMISLFIIILTFTYYGCEWYRWGEVHDLVRHKYKNAALDNCDSFRAFRTHETGIGELPVEIVNGVKTFVFFMGHSRSGHSIIGTILDSHPHIVIAHESGILTRVLNRQCADKSFVLNEIWRGSSSNRTKYAESTTRKGYTLGIDELYQGKYLDHIEVMGEKQGSTASLLYARSPDTFQTLLDKLKSTLHVPIKVLHVVRNPYDNIATLVLYSSYDVMQVTKLKYSNKTINVAPEVIDKQIRIYFVRYKAIEEAEKVLNLDLMRIHNVEFVSQPRVVIGKLCKFLGVGCSEEFINKCSEKIFNKESKTRYKLKWQDYQIKEIKANIQKLDSLSGYDFNS